MDCIQRAYAQTAYTPFDPLAGLDPPLRRALLVMPSTFRERWKLAPWVSRDSRRRVIAEILAERRLMLELESPPLGGQASAFGHLEPAAEATYGPYYQRRLAAMAEERRVEDLTEVSRNVDAQKDYAHRLAIRERWHALQAEKARLEAREAELIASLAENPADVSLLHATPQEEPRLPPQRRRQRERER